MRTPLNADDPTPGESALADTCIRVAIDARFADEHGNLTWAGLHALPALAAMLDAMVDDLVTEGHGDALLRVSDIASRAFAVIRLLDGDDALQRRLLGGTS